MLRRLFLTGLAGLCLMSPASASAEPQVRLVVMHEDADFDTLPRGTALSTELSAVIAEVLAENGFAAGVDTDLFPELAGRKRMSAAELLDYPPRLTDPPVDAALLFTVFAEVQADAFAPSRMQLRTRLSGRLVQTATAATLGVHAATQDPVTLPQGCHGQCVLEATAAQATVLARALAQAMVAKIAAE